MCFGGSSNNSSSRTSYFKDRCWGCKYYDGFNSFIGEDTITKCSLGRTGVTLSSGCYDFEPDNTANCNNCFFHTKKEEGNFNKWHCTVHNITTMRATEFPGNSGYCQEFYHRNSNR